MRVNTQLNHYVMEATHTPFLMNELVMSQAQIIGKTIACSMLSEERVADLAMESH